MGLLTDTLTTALARVVPERKEAVGMAVQVGEAGRPMYPQNPGLGLYRKYALEGYSANDLVYAAIEERATSAAEPRLACYTRPTQGDPEKVTQHPLIQLFEAPNPFCDRYTFMASVVMFLDVAGNAFLHKERSGGGKVAQLWHLRPDRVRVVPDEQRHIRGYEYTLGARRWMLPPDDVLHIRTRAVLDDYYGLPPLAVAAQWTDVANAVAHFTQAFFRNGAVLSGLLTLQKTVSSAERELIRTQFRNEHGGSNAWKVAVLDGQEASYTAMGLPLGERGLAMPSLDELLEAHVVRPFGVPLELVGARLSMRGQRSAVREARAGFWDETLQPLYTMIAAQIQMGFVNEPVYGDGWDYLGFDTSTVAALQEDADAKHKRVREDMLAGLIAQDEARAALGYAEQVPPEAIWVLGSGVTMTDDPLKEETPAPLALPPGAAQPNGEEAGATDAAKVAAWEQESKADGMGVIVCLAVPPNVADALAVAGGEPPTRLHCTLAYLGEATPRQRTTARQVVGQVVGRYGPLVGTVSGIGRFAGIPGASDVLYASLDIPALTPLRQALVAALQQAGLTVAHGHGFTPHITLAYLPRDAYSPLSRLDPIPVVFEALDLWAGDDHQAFPLRPPHVTARQPAGRKVADVPSDGDIATARRWAAPLAPAGLEGLLDATVVSKNGRG